MPRELQWVWPKDGPKGKNNRGWFGRLNDVMTNRGPDIFLQRQKSSKNIPIEHWSNWDSYHDRNLKAEEENCASVFKSRGARRYDPQTRRYVEWCIPGDPDSKQHDLNSIPSARYPRFTLDEMPKLQRKLDETRTGGQITPLKASDWNWTGPDRFLQPHNAFWQNAHRIGEINRQGGLVPNSPNPFLLMHQNTPGDFQSWIADEIYWGRLRW